MAVDPTRACVNDFRKYADTVAVSAGISHLFDITPNLGKFVGIEHRLSTSQDDLLTPDITTLYDNDSKGLLFDMKYSLPRELQNTKSELLELEKYKNAKKGWGISGTVSSIDFVLVCHMEDAKRATDAAREIYRETSKPFFSSGSLSIWSWAIGLSRADEKKEEMRLLPIYGSSKNPKLQAMIQQPAGILLPEEVLTALRFTQVFVRQRPPVQYTMSILIQNVFSALPPIPLSLASPAKDYVVNLDTISQKVNVLFPPWWEADTKTVQVKRGWIKEAMDTLAKVQMIDVVDRSTESYRISPRKWASKKPLPQLVCERLQAFAKRKPRGRPPSPGKIETKKVEQSRKLTEYMEAVRLEA